MLINVTGIKKPIPGIGLLPPVKNYDATEAIIRRLINFNDYRVYESNTGRLITVSNVDDFFTSGGSGGSSGGTTTVNWKVLK